MKIPFSTNDIENSLSIRDQRRGEFNQLGWSVDAGNNTSDHTSVLLSTHEFLHSNLNSSTSYGNLLQTYALLAKQSSPRKDFYNKTLKQLIDRSRLPHEVYATWLSVQGLKISKDKAEGLLLNDNAEYLFYFTSGENLVSGVPGKVLKKIVFNSCIFICFECIELIEMATRDINLLV